MLKLPLKYRFNIIFISVTFSPYKEVNSGNLILPIWVLLFAKETNCFYLEFALVLSSIQSTDVAPNWLVL